MSVVHEFKTVTRKNTHNEWVIRSTTMLDEERSLQLTVTTNRYCGKQLVSYAAVDTVNKETNITSHSIYSDFYNKVTASNPKRLTLKLVEAQHNTLDLASIVQDAIEFYKNK